MVAEKAHIPAPELPRLLGRWLGGLVISKIDFSKSYKNASKALPRGHKYSDMYLYGISKSFLRFSRIFDPIFRKIIFFDIPSDSDLLDIGVSTPPRGKKQGSKNNKKTEKFKKIAPLFHAHLI